jgi:hypothetical protein
MRILALVLLVSIPTVAATLELEETTTCEGVGYPGNPASCSASLFTNYLVYAVSAEANAGLAEAREYDGGASAFVFGDFVLTVTGGSGDGFLDPLLQAYTTSSGSGAAGAQASLYEPSSGYGCSSSSTVPCGPMSLPFVFGVPEILNLTLIADAVGAPGDAYAIATYGPFEFFDASGQPLSDVSYSFVPVGEVPEPGTLLLAAMACGALIACDQRRRKRLHNGR